MLDYFTSDVSAQQSMKTTQRRAVPQGKWLNDADEVFNYLERHQIEKDSWWKSMGTTLKLLKQAHEIIFET